MQLAIRLMHIMSSLLTSYHIKWAGPKMLVGINNFEYSFSSFCLKEAVHVDFIDLKSQIEVRKDVCMLSAWACVSYFMQARLGADNAVAAVSSSWKKGNVFASSSQEFLIVISLIDHQPLWISHFLFLYTPRKLHLVH
jgi:hypothetical protein